jgi:ribosomal protein S1
MRRAASNKRKSAVTLKLEDMTPGMELEGTVKFTTAYGAFIGDMGPADRWLAPC